MRCFFIPFTGILHVLRTFFRSFSLSCQKKIQPTHFFYTFGYVWFSHFLFNFHETTRLSPISLHTPSLFLGNIAVESPTGSFFITFHLHIIPPQSSLRLASSAQGTPFGCPTGEPFSLASPLGVTPHGVGRCPEGTEGTAQYEGDRRQAVVGFPAHFKKKVYELAKI